MLWQTARRYTSCFVNVRAESVRVLLDITDGSCGMRVEESTALNEEEIMFWLTLKRSNITSILTAVMVPHVVAAWLDMEERDAT